MRDEPLWHAGGAQLLRGAPERERLGLGEGVREQEVVMLGGWLERPGEGDQVAGHEPRPLVEELEEAVLGVRARLAPDDRRSVVGERGAVARDPLAVRLHRKLLEVRGETVE